MAEGWTPEGEKVMRELDNLGKLVVKIGYQHGKAKEDDGTDICDIAAWNELGTVNMPSRPFLRKSIDENEDKIVAYLQEEAAKVVRSGKTAEHVLKEIGIFQKDLVQEKIVEGEFVPNSPSTIRKKGSSRPLIDTGRMRQSVNYVIKPKGGG